MFIWAGARLPSGLRVTQAMCHELGCHLVKTRLPVTTSLTLRLASKLQQANHTTPAEHHDP